MKKTMRDRQRIRGLWVLINITASSLTFLVLFGLYDWLRYEGLRTDQWQLLSKGNAILEHMQEQLDRTNQQLSNTQGYAEEAMRAFQQDASDIQRVLCKHDPHLCRDSQQTLQMIELNKRLDQIEKSLTAKSE